MTEDAKRIIDDSIRAVLPDAAVYRALEGRRFDRPVTVIAIGKAAWRMANAAAKALGENLREGIVITKYGHSEGDIPRMTIYEAAHPIPDEAGVAATRAALALADRLHRAFLDSQVGRTADVLLETTADGWFTGFTPDYAPVRVRGDALHNEIRRVRIDGTDSDVCIGTLVD